MLAQQQLDIEHDAFQKLGTPLRHDFLAVALRLLHVARLLQQLRLRQQDLHAVRQIRLQAAIRDEHAVLQSACHVLDPEPAFARSYRPVDVLHPELFVVRARDQTALEQYSDRVLHDTNPTTRTVVPLMSSQSRYARQFARSFWLTGLKWK